MADRYGNEVDTSFEHLPQTRLPKPSTANSIPSHAYRDATTEPLLRPAPSSVRAKQSSQPRAGTAPANAKRGKWPMPQSSGLPMHPLLATSPSRAKLGSSMSNFGHGGRAVFVERDGHPVPVQQGFTVIDSFSQDILEGPMAIRIMHKLRQVEEYMKGKPGPGKGGGGVPTSLPLDGNQSQLLEQMNHRIMGLEGKLASTENARKAAQARVENMFAKMEKSVNDARMDFEGDGGVGRKQLKESAAASAAAVASSEKMKLSVASMERRLADMETSHGSLEGKSTKMESRQKGTTSELEELCVKVHELDMVVQQWTRGYASSRGSQVEITSAPARDRPPAGGGGGPPILVELGERVGRMEEAQARLEAQLGGVSAGMEGVGQVEEAQARLEAQLAEVSVGMEGVVRMEEAQEKLEAQIGEVSAGMEGRLAELSQAMQLKLASSGPSVPMDTVDALGRELAALKDATEKLAAASQLDSLEAKLAESTAASSALMEKLQQQLSSSTSSVSTLSERLHTLEKVSPSAATPTQNVTEAGSASMQPQIDELRGLVYAAMPRAEVDALLAAAAAVTVPRAEVDTLLTAAAADYSEKLATLRGRLTPLFDELVKRIKALEGRAETDTQELRVAALEARGPRMGDTSVPPSASPSMMKNLSMKQDSELLGIIMDIERIGMRVRDLEEAGEKLAAAPAVQSPFAAAVSHGGGGGAVEALVEEYNAKTNDRLTTLQTKVTNLLQVVVARLKALEASELTPSRSGSIASLDSINMDRGQTPPGGSSAAVSSDQLAALQAQLVPEMKAMDSRLQALEARTDSTGAPTSVGGGGGGDMGDMVARLDVLEPKLAEVEATAFEKMDTLQTKVTAVLQLMLGRLKKLENSVFTDDDANVV